MKRDKLEQVLRVLAIFDALAQKRGAYRLGQITEWATMSRATVDRYLRAMEELGLVEKTEAVYAGKPCRVFSMTDDGMSLLRIFEN